MQTMAVAWNGTTLNDKVKLLSGTEAGIDRYQSTYFTIEGTIYIPFNRHQLDSYWVRTSVGTNAGFYDSELCGTNWTTYSKSRSIMASIRLSELNS